MFLLVISVRSFSIGYKHSTKDLLVFDVIVSDLAEPILGQPNVTEISYQSCIYLEYPTTLVFLQFAVERQCGKVG